MWLEFEDRIIVQAVQDDVFLVGPYLLIAVGAAIVVVALLGVFGAACQKKFNRVILILVSWATDTRVSMVGPAVGSACGGINLPPPSSLCSTSPSCSSSSWRS